MAVTLYSENKGDNNLGLLDDQTKQSAKAPNNRTRIKREAYEALHKQLLADKSKFADEDGKLTHDAQTQIEDILRSLSSRTIEDTRHNLNRDNPIVDKMLTELNDEDAAVFDLFKNTIEAAEKNKLGQALLGYYFHTHSKLSRIDPDLANVILHFSALYAGNKQNPLLSDEAVNIIKNCDIFTPGAKRKAVKLYMDQLASAIINLQNIPKSTLNRTFPEDDVKANVIVRKPINKFNWLSARIDHDQQFKNIGKKRTALQAKRVEQQIKVNREKKKNEGYVFLLSEAEQKEREKLAILESDRHKNKDGEAFNYAYKKVKLTKFKTQEKMADKQKSKKVKNALRVIAILVAIGVAVGQASIAMAALSGMFAVVIGLASWFTNFFLIQGGTAKLLIKGKKTRLFFKGLPVKLGLPLGLFGVFSFIAGILSAGAVFECMLTVMHVTIATATPFSLIIAGATALVTLIGMTSLYFADFAGYIRNAKGKTIFDVKAKDENGNEKVLQKGLGTRIKNAWNNLITPPEYNRDILDLKKEIKAKKVEKNNLRRQGKKTNHLDTQIKLLNRKKKVAQKMHLTRHWLSVAISILFVPFALAFSVITSVVLLQLSLKGTTDLFQSFFGWGKKLSDTIASALTWAIGLPVNAFLYTNSLVGAATTFGKKLGAFLASIVNFVIMTGVRIYEGNFIECMKDSLNVYLIHKDKLVRNGLRSFALFVMCVFVVLNAYGNAGSYAKFSSFTTPFWRFISSFFGSASLNALAIFKEFQKITPMDTLKADAGKGSYTKVMPKLGSARKAANVAKRAVKAQNKGIRATFKNWKFTLSFFGKAKNKAADNRENIENSGILEAIK